VLLRQKDAPNAKIQPVEPPPASILVPAWRERGTVERCIGSLQRLADRSWEAIVVAGGPDGTNEAVVAATAGDERFRVLQQGPGGKNAALNAAAAMARHDVLVVLDADSEVEPDWLEALVAPLSEGASASMGDFFPRRETWVSLAEQMTKIEAYALLGSTSLQGSGSIGLRREVVNRLGGFPEDVPVGVDWDLGMRLAAAGEPIVFVERARLRTDRPSTPREVWSNDVRWHRAHLHGLWRHRAVAFRTLPETVVRLYFYALSALLFLLGGAGLAVGIVRPSTRPALAKGCAMGAVWLSGRRAAQAAEIAAFTGDARWLKLAWGPAILLPLQVTAAAWAMATVRRTTPHFKGPRTDMSPARFDPVAIDTSNALDYAGFLVAQRRPATIRLATGDPDVAVAAVRRLPWFRGLLLVDDDRVKDAVRPHHRGRAEVAPAVRADLGWSLFADRAVDRGETTLVVVERNGLSYTALLGRSSIRASSWRTARRLARDRRVRDQVGILAPPFLWRWAISLVAGKHAPGTYYLFAQRAMERVVERSWLWRFGAVVVICADESCADEPPTRHRAGAAVM
jgi:glycosyltransferase involved in cell wall biosynthesis